jgi:hypothetical protein
MLRMNHGQQPAWGVLPYQTKLRMKLVSYIINSRHLVTMPQHHHHN